MDKFITSAWVDWCRGAGFDSGEYWHLLTPQPTANLYRVDSLADFNHLLYAYKPRSYYSQIPQIAEAMGHTPLDDMVFLNFEEIAKHYDGIWLTHRGNRETHLSFPNNLNGWDCESILWFRWCFSAAECLGKKTLLDASYEDDDEDGQEAASTPVNNKTKHWMTEW